MTVGGGYSQTMQKAEESKPAQPAYDAARVFNEIKRQLNCDDGVATILTLAHCLQSSIDIESLGDGDGKPERLDSDTSEGTGSSN